MLATHPYIPLVEWAHCHAFIHPCDRAGNSFKHRPSSGAAQWTEGEFALVEDSDVLPLYPNPSQGAFMIPLQEGQFASDVRVFDTMGRPVPVILKRYASHIEADPVEQVSGGTYAVRITFKNGNSRTAKIIIQP